MLKHIWQSVKGKSDKVKETAIWTVSDMDWNLEVPGPGLQQPNEKENSDPRVIANSFGKQENVH